MTSIRRAEVARPRVVYRLGGKVSERILERLGQLLTCTDR